MKKIPAIGLLLLGALWVYWATIVPQTMRMRAMSDAMQLEADLHQWLREKVSDGKLTEADMGEIFGESRDLRFGGEQQDRNFREMISVVAKSSAPPLWPGIVAIVLAVSAFFASGSGAESRKEQKGPETGESALPQ